MFVTHRRYLLSALAALALAACSSTPQIQAEIDPNTDFSQYRTWSWHHPIALEESGYSSWISEHIRAGIQREMQARGYQKVETTPDLLVNFQGILKERTQVSTVSHTSYPQYWGYRRGYAAMPRWYDETVVHNYTEGTLSIDLVDAKRQHMVWAGDAIGRVTRSSQQERAEDIDEAIRAIFEKYPHRAATP